MDARTQPTAVQPAAKEHSVLLVIALLAGAAIEIALVAAVAAAVGLPPAPAVAAGAVVTLTVSTIAALALGAWLGRCPAEPELVITLPEPVSLARRDALELVEAAEARLLRAVEVGAQEAELMSCALDLQAARLRLARVHLVEDGELPQALADELLVAHRGTSDWQRSPRLT